MRMPDRGRWPSLNAHLDRALDMSDAERDAWLKQLEHEQPALAGELRELLAGASEPAFGEFLAGQPPIAPSIATAPAMIGRRVGAYVIESEIGRGGMGSVWRAVRADGQFEGYVAVKLVHASWLGREGEQRFRREGRLLARLQHPRIARLLDAGLLDDRQPYLVLEYVEGQPIDAYCDERRLDVVARIRLFLGVLDAVAHAHNHLIVHRDIKPSNILVTFAGDPKLLDFGVAKPLHAETDCPAITRPGVGAMTPDYAAPEQLVGEPVTTLTDVYSLGLVLYRLLTGMPPRQRGARSAAEFVRAVIEQDVPRASTVASDATARRTLAGDLDNILAKALKRQPGERYASAGAFADDLLRFLADEPVLARPDTVAYRATKFVRRHRGGVTAAVLLAMALVATTLTAVDEMLEARRMRDRAEAELQRAQAFNDLVAIVLNESDPQGHLTTGELLDRGERLVRSEFAAIPLLRAQLLSTLATLYQQAGLTGKEHRLSQDAFLLARQAGDPDMIARAGCALARSDAVTGRPAPALDRVRHQLARLSTNGSDDEARAHCLLSASIIESQLGDGTRAVNDAALAAAILSRSRHVTTWERLNSQITLADAERKAGRLLDAEALYGRVSDGFVRLGVQDTGFAATLYNNRAIVLMSLGQPMLAARLLERVLDYDRTQVAPDAYARVNYAAALVALDRAVEARRVLEPALGDAMANGNRVSSAMVRMALAAVDRELGELDRSDELLRQTEGDLRTLLPDGHEAFGALHLNRALLAQKRQDYATGLGEIDRAIAIFSARPGLALRAATTQLTRAEILLALGRTGEARAEDDAARTMLQRIVGADAKSSNLGRAWLVAAQIDARQDDATATRAAAHQAYVQLAATVGARHPLTLMAQDLAGAS